MIRFLWLLCVIGVCPCVFAASEASPASGTVVWSAPVDGLSIAVEVPGNRLPAEKSVHLRLGFRNVTDQPIRIYLVQGDFFRSFQCSFFLQTPNGKGWLGHISPPHGYVVTESDFPLIPPKGESWFDHSLGYDRAQIKGFEAQTGLIWTYSNEVEQWAGGVQTMDGPTQALFGGGKIPFIWKGQVTVTQPLTASSSIPGPDN